MHMAGLIYTKVDWRGPEAANRLWKPVAAGLLAVIVTLLLVAISPAHTRLPAALAASYDAASIERGADLALIGNCSACHTAPGGRSYAGGRALKTPFGVLYGPNITPDAETGIGRWSQAAFARAMRDGVDADGGELYPAFPYEHYARVANDDIRALYAYLMTRDPVNAQRVAHELRFPFNVRPLVRLWKVLYLRPEPFVASAARDAQWNRDARSATRRRRIGRLARAAAERGVAGAGAVLEIDVDRDSGRIRVLRS